MANVVCLIQQVDVTYATDETSNTTGVDDFPYVCFLGNQVYGIDIPANISNQLDLQDESKSVITISSAWIDQTNALITMESGASVTIGGGAPSGRRRLAPAIGENTVLVLRVHYFSYEPYYSSNELAGLIFGIGPNASNVNVAKQYHSCSFGKLSLIPATGKGIQNGVADIYITTTVTGSYSVRALENLVASAATKLYGLNSDMLVMDMPSAPGLLFGGSTSWLSYVSRDAGDSSAGSI